MNAPITKFENSTVPPPKSNDTIIFVPQPMDGKAGPGGTSEGVLANFFNSLLSKKTGAPGAPGPGGPTPPGGHARPGQ